MKKTQKFIAWLVVVFLLVALGIAVSFWTFRQIEEASAVRTHTYNVLGGGHEFIFALNEAEASQHRYLLTGDEALLQPYLELSVSLSSNLQKLRAITLDSAAQKHLDAVLPLLDEKLAQMLSAISLRRSNDVAAALSTVRNYQGRRLMDTIHAEMSSFIRLEEEILEQRESAFQASMRQMFSIIVAASLLTLLLLLAFTWLVKRESKQWIKNLILLETQHLLGVQEGINNQLLQANLTLQASERKLAVTLNSIGDAVIATDAEARVTLMNPLAEQLTGWTLAQANGRPVSEIFIIVNKETRLPASIPVMEKLAQGKAQDTATHTVLIATDGSECDISDSYAPMHDSDGKVIGAVLVFRDVSREYAAQQDLLDSAAQIQTILNTVEDGIITLHARDGTIETVNPATLRMFGYTSAELTGQKFSLLIPELELYQRNSTLEYYGASDDERASGLRREVVGRRKNDSNFPMEIAVSEMWLGGQRYFTGILRDITVRKQVETERSQHFEVLQGKNAELERARMVAEKANLAKSEFLSSMSHELRTPLNAILGFAQLLEAGSPSPTPSQSTRLQQITKAGWYLLELINEILDLAVIESGKVSLSRESVSLPEVLHECQAMIETQAKKHKIHINYLPFEHGCNVNADRTRLKQVLINLLTNAIKYNHEQGTVDVTCTMTTPERIRISIKDSGTGLSEESLTHLFQPFNRLGQENGTEEGTGIGLVVTKQLVELMDGSIGVESTVGVGSEFWIELNVDVMPEPVSANIKPKKLSTPVPVDAALRTLLYVEDNPANLMLVEQIIAGHTQISMLSARDGKLGVELARSQLPDVILMDINLPGVSGYDALNILRADPLTAHIPIIALSANAMTVDIEKGMAAGFYRYLTKPIKIKELMNALNAAIKFSEMKNETGQTL